MSEVHRREVLAAISAAATFSFSGCSSAPGNTDTGDGGRDDVTWETEMASRGHLTYTDGLLVASSAGGLSAVNPHTGRKEWTYTLGEPSEQTAYTGLYTCRNGDIFTSGFDKSVSLSLDGNEQWQSEAEYGGQPAVTDEAVVMARFKAGALSRSTGESLWENDVPEIANGMTWPVTGHGYVFTTDTGRARGIALDTTTGALEDTIELAGQEDGQGGPALVTDDWVLMFSNGERLQATSYLNWIDPETLTVRETLKVPEFALMQDAVLTGDSLVFKPYESIVCLDIADREVRWRFEAGGTGVGRTWPYTVSDNGVLVGDYDGRIHRVALDDGASEVVFEATDTSSIHSPVLGDDSVYAFLDDTLVAIPT